jgi:hypothetical protein
VFVSGVRKLGARALAESIQTGAEPPGPIATATALEAGGRWRVIDRREFVAFVTADVCELEPTAQANGRP